MKCDTCGSHDGVQLNNFLLVADHATVRDQFLTFQKEQTVYCKNEQLTI